LDRRYAVLCIGTWLAILGLWIPAYYLKPYANAVYPGNTVSNYFLCMLNGSSIMGATFGGFIGDQIGRLNLLWPITLVSGCLCLFLWLLSNSMATLILFVCVYGFCTSNVTALPPSVIGHITPDDKLGARIGAFYSVIAIASLVGTPIGGALITDHDTKEGYRWLILFSVGYSLTISTYPVQSLTSNRVLRSWSDQVLCSSVGCCMTEPCIRSGRQVIVHKEEEMVLVMKLVHSRWSDAILYTTLAGPCGVT
jgi:MCP family monocarboxylic acid transporter-like MFS transporter 10